MNQQKKLNSKNRKDIPLEHKNLKKYRHKRYKKDTECQGCCINPMNMPACSTDSTITCQDKTHTCPCQVCIVKMMCVKACSNYLRYSLINDKLRSEEMEEHEDLPQQEYNI